MEEDPKTDTAYILAETDWQLWHEAYQRYNEEAGNEHLCAYIVSSLEFKGFFNRLHRDGPWEAPWPAIRSVRAIAEGLVRAHEQGERDGDNAIAEFRRASAEFNRWGLQYFASSTPPWRRAQRGSGCLGATLTMLLITTAMIFGCCCSMSHV